MAKYEPAYMLLPKRLMFLVLGAYLALLIGVLASFQYANFVDRRSNQRLCGVVVLSNKAYSAHPPTTEITRQIAGAMLQLQKDYNCK